MADSQRTDLIVDVLGDAFAPADGGRPGRLPGEVPQDGLRPALVLPGHGVPVLRRRDRREGRWADDFCDEQAGRIWVHGDLHVENFGTYLNSDGRLVFDVNDFDEAYLGRFTWDLQRFAASLALVGLAEGAAGGGRAAADRRLRARLPRPGRRLPAQRGRRRLRAAPRQHRRPGARGAGRGPLPAPRRPARRLHGARATAPAPSATTARCGGSASASGQQVVRAFEGYLETIPEDKRFDRVALLRPARRRRQVRASGSAAPASRRTTCWSRATARRSTTTSCCR